MGGKTNSYLSCAECSVLCPSTKRVHQAAGDKLQKAAEEKKEMEEIVSELQKALTAKQGKKFSAYNLLLHSRKLVMLNL